MDYIKYSIKLIFKIWLLKHLQLHLWPNICDCIVFLMHSNDLDHCVPPVLSDSPNFSQSPPTSRIFDKPLIL